MYVNSTIIRKKCKCGCNKYPTMSCFGYFYEHMPEYLKKKAGTRKKVQVKNQNRRKAITVKLRADKFKKDVLAGSNLKELWFRSCRVRMTGFCVCGCGEPSSKNDNENFRSSAAHVLSKALFPDIMFHPENFIELNFWNGCHTTFDSMGYEHCKKTKPKLWRIIINKFKILYPLIDKSEHQFIPQVLLDTLDYQKTSE